jgi:hypothetical protein
MDPEADEQVEVAIYCPLCATYEFDDIPRTIKKLRRRARLSVERTVTAPAVRIGRTLTRE